eukprot:762374-Rhodomonas_salina.4
MPPPPRLDASCTSSDAESTASTASRCSVASQPAKSPMASIPAESSFAAAGVIWAGRTVHRV